MWILSMTHFPAFSLDTVVFSDIQGNFPALKRLFQHPDFQRDDAKFVCLGDIVQRGTHYDDYLCVKLLQQQGVSMVKGNHEDKVLSHAHALHPALFPESVNFLEGLPLGLSLGDGIYASHHGPSGEGYLRDVDDARRAFELVPSDMRMYFFGHSHQPLVFERLGSGSVVQRPVAIPLQLRCGSRYLINPGAVGARGIPSTYLVYDPSRQQILFREISLARLHCNHQDVASFD